MAATERVEMLGHVLDDGSLPKVLNEILGQDGDYMIERFEVGKKAEDSSIVRIAVTARNEEILQQVVNRLQRYGANLAEPGEPTLVTADVAGAFPEGFYSSTNLETEIFLEGAWHRVERPEMDCGIVVADGVAGTKPMSEIQVGDQVERVSDSRPHQTIP